MPAPTKQRKGALRAAQTKKSTQTARSKAAEASAQTEDPDFVDETGAEIEFEGDDQVEKDEGVGGGSKRKPLTDAQLDARKRRREDADILCPAEPPVKGRSRTSLWRDANGLTKKARSKQSTNLLSLWVNKTAAAPTAKLHPPMHLDTPPSVSASPSPLLAADPDTEMQDVRIDSVPRVVPTQNLPIDVDALDDVQLDASVISEQAENGAAANVNKQAAVGDEVEDEDEEGGYSTTQSDAEQQRLELSRAEIEDEFRELNGKLKNSEFYRVT
ncbi:hypothetical protein R3P38DRAFT_3361827 [Favolaschia claudopus]|uniref:Uncharacterized protein n=1 Tax=Favolaschia claudopus TaxID=2862362 RepID=A0AAW0ASX8_9AGAR